MNTEEIYNIIKRHLENCYGSNLSIENRYNTENKTKIYYKSTILFFNRAAIKLQLGNANYIYLKNSYADKFNELNFQKSDELWKRITFSNINHIELLFTVIKEIYFDYQPTTFGCCSSYLECSDKKECIKSSVKFSNECSYRKKIKQGIFYYGVNRNI